MINVTDLQASIEEYIATHMSNPLHAQSVSKVSIDKCLGHVVATDITAPINMPRQDVSAMDGYALSAGSELSMGSQFLLIGESAAGKPMVTNQKHHSITTGQAIRIMTGATVPDGFDNVVMQENVRREDEYIILQKASQFGNNIRQRGEDIQSGETILTQGTIIQPQHISLLATIGMERVEVFESLRIGLIASGDELIAPGNPLNSEQIYNANTPSLQALLSGMPIKVIDYGIVRDDLSDTAELIAKAASECDVIISTAGVSAGDYDYLTTAIDHLGKINHYKVAMKPGKPLVFGEVHNADDADSARKCIYFGLPGNPLSTFVSGSLIIKPALWQLSGALHPPTALHLSATLAAPVQKRVGRRDFQRGVIEQNQQGNWAVTPLSEQDSHRVKALSVANCLLDIPESCGDLKQGQSIAVLPFTSQYL